MRNFSVRIPQMEFFFTTEGGGCPTKIVVTEFGGKKITPIFLEKSLFSIFCKGETYAPYCDEKTLVFRKRGGEAEIVEFPRLKWRNRKGEELAELYLALKWEIFQDGAVFCDLFLFYATLQVPELKDFKLAIPLDISSFDDVKWSVQLPPEKIDATIIQSVGPERFLSREEQRTFKGRLFTQASFSAMRDHGASFYAEFFLEGVNSLFNRNLTDTASAIIPGKNGFLLEWNFQEKSQTGNNRPLHWRNRFGFLLRPPPVKRLHKPYAMTHYIDNFQRLPSADQVRALAQAGVEVLIMHDCWRFDTQNGGIPYDFKRFQTLVRQLHARGIRLVVYVRGNEISVMEDAASWFDSLLRKDFDGLYMDYGGPAGYFVASHENYPGGRTEYRRYYLCMKALRERVGEKGLFFAHTGPAYSALGSSFWDGYVSGEGERGILVKGRGEHEYFSMSAVSPGTMWTAAFPEYGSPKMTPFLAATAQSPHLPIGKQIESSSLRHPPVPGISDQAFRKLLDAWRILEDGVHYEYYTDFNSEGIFDSNSELAHCVILAPGGKYGIYLLSNCSSEIKSGDFSLFGLLGNYEVQPLEEGKSVFAPYEIRTALIARNKKYFKHISIPQSAIQIPSTQTAREYRLLLETQKKNREIKAKNPLLQVYFPSRITSHEQSLWDDLYDVVFFLRKRMEDGSYRQLGYVSRNGLKTEVPSKEEQLQPGERSAVIDLRALLGDGEHELQIYSEHLGVPFYSFPIAEIKGDTQVYRVEFMNELEADRAILHWKIY